MNHQKYRFWQETFDLLKDKWIIVCLRISPNRFAGILKKLTAKPHIAPGVSAHLLSILSSTGTFICVKPIYSWSSPHEKKDTITDQHSGQYSGTSLERFRILKISFIKQLCDLASLFLLLLRNFKGERKISVLWKPHRWRSLQKAVPGVCTKLHFQAICLAIMEWSREYNPTLSFLQGPHCAIEALIN